MNFKTLFQKKQEELLYQKTKTETVNDYKKRQKKLLYEKKSFES